MGLKISGFGWDVGDRERGVNISEGEIVAMLDMKWTGTGRSESSTSILK